MQLCTIVHYLTASGGLVWRRVPCQQGFGEIDLPGFVCPKKQKENVKELDLGQPGAYSPACL